MVAGSNKIGTWASFSAEIRNGGNNNKRCRIARLMEELPIEGRIAVTGAIANRDLSAAAITRALESRGYKISLWVVNHHRRRQCSCPKA